MTITLDEIWSVRKVAEYCDVSKQAVYKAISEGRLPSIELCGGVYVTRQAAREWKKLGSYQRKNRK